MAKAQSIVGISVQAPTGINARMIARTRLEELLSWDQYVSLPYAVHELHDLRIASKRLRYTFEIFGDVLPVACKLAIGEIEQIQEELGSMHDSDVLIALLRLCLGSWDAGTSYSTLLAQVHKISTNGRFLLNPALLEVLLDTRAVPSAEERAGLEELLFNLQNDRKAQYSAFRLHWERLSAENLFQELLVILAD
jgi:CHAD domain